MTTPYNEKMKQESFQHDGMLISPILLGYCNGHDLFGVQVQLNNFWFHSGTFEMASGADFSEIRTEAISLAISTRGAMLTWRHAIHQFVATRRRIMNEGTIVNIPLDEIEPEVRSHINHAQAVVAAQNEKLAALGLIAAVTAKTQTDLAIKYASVRNGQVIRFSAVQQHRYSAD
jgi:hypothetical protein